MGTPFEDLEYLAEYLPDEGEAVIVARRGGELVCEPFRQEAPQERSLDAELYGRLVQANERLNSVGAIPIWAAALSAFVLCVAAHKLFGLGWSGWYVDLGILFAAAGACYATIQWAQKRLFVQQLRPMIEKQLRHRSIPKHALIGVARQHSELRILLDHLVHWVD